MGTTLIALIIVGLPMYGIYRFLRAMRGAARQHKKNFYLEVLEEDRKRANG